jgi:hypothetical protein
MYTTSQNKVILSTKLLKCSLCGGIKLREMEGNNKLIMCKLIFDDNLQFLA